MSGLLRTIVGKVHPQRKIIDENEVPVPYRRNLPVNPAPVAKGSQPGEPAKAPTPIADNPSN